MLDPKILDDLSRRVSEGMPKGLAALQEDFQRNLRATLEAALRQLDLVTRDEFDIQQAVLARTREKLEALEQRVTALEKQQHAPSRSAEPSQHDP
ncbi:MAG: accessory factor UbiK family protein [Gammaproteobacteria bacterium]|nr:MAG: accessory factor UbiK family protein [Gammaproteobacteria bacterium]